jgi:chromosome segregation ATPase
LPPSREPSKTNNKMPFEITTDEETPVQTENESAPAAPSRQLALFRSEAVDVAPLARRGKPSLQDIQLHISHLGGQIDTLRQQLRDHSSDRLALLLHEMIEERERELDRWIAQESRWDERVSALESAISERDAFRRREAELTAERDAARAQAHTAAERLAAAERAAEAERRRIQALERSAGEAQAEQLRLRQERQLDESNWQSERRRLAGEMERMKSGWLGRLMKA